MKKKFGIVVAGLLSFAIVLSGCGGSSDVATSVESKQMAPASVDEAVYENATEEAIAEDADYSEEHESEEGEEVVDTSRKLITTVHISAETENLDDTLSKLEGKVSELGGYIESSNVSNGSSFYGNNDIRTADFVIRIPADNLNNFVESVQDATNITSKSTNVEDVTLNYVDLESKKNALLAEEQSLLGILESADKIEDIIAVQDRLTQVRYELESAESQLRTFDNKVNYSTVNLNIEEVAKFTPTEEKGALQRMGEGFVESLSGVGHGIVEFIVWIVIHIPQLLLLAIVIFVIVFITKKANKKREEKRAQFMRTHGTPANQAPVNGYTPVSTETPATPAATTSNENTEGKDGK